MPNQNFIQDFEEMTSDLNERQQENLERADAFIKAFSPPTELVLNLIYGDRFPRRA
jgi:hypothetical protein